MPNFHVPGLEGQENSHYEQEALVDEQDAEPDESVFGSTETDNLREILGLHVWGGGGEEKVGAFWYTNATL